MIKQNSSPKYWCHSCKHQFFTSQQQISCPSCLGEFCEEINEQNNPKNYVPSEIKKHKAKNLTKHIQINYFVTKEEPFVIAN